MAHDVSAELRGYHGRWSKSSAMKRVVESAAKSGTGGSSEKAAAFKAGDKVKYRTGASGTIHHIDEKGTPHVVWDRGRGNPVRTPAHHLTHAEAQVHVPAKPGAPERGQKHETPAQERHLEETLRKLAGAPTAAEKRALANITGYSERSITGANIGRIRAYAKSLQSQPRKSLWRTTFQRSSAATTAGGQKEQH